MAKSTNRKRNTFLGLKLDDVLLYFIFTVMTLTTVVLLIPFTVVGLSLAFVMPIVCKLYRRCNAGEIPAEWLQDFSPSSYYPMEGLLAEEDFRFLSRQPGFDLSLYRKLRRERLHIFKQYLSRLILDFNRLHTIARLVLARSHEDRSDLLARLVWLKMKFSLAVIHAEFSYALCCIGFRSLAAQSVILRLEEMNAHLGAISATQFA